MSTQSYIDNTKTEVWGFNYSSKNIFSAPSQSQAQFLKTDGKRVNYDNFSSTTSNDSPIKKPTSIFQRSKSFEKNESNFEMFNGSFDRRFAVFCQCRHASDVD